MSTLKDSTLAPPAVPDTTLGPDPGAYMKPEIAVPDRAAEYTPPLEDDLRDFARQEFEANQVFEERWAAQAPKRAAEVKRHKRLKKMLMAVAGVAVVGAMTLGAGSIAPEPVPVPEPAPADTSTVRQVLSDHPNWYSAEYDVYLHFNEGVGWLYDHGDFHRLVWTIKGEGTDEEHLVIETGYSYLLTADGGWHSDEIISELQVAAEGDSFTITGVTGISFHDDASTTFTPVDTIGVNSTYVDRFGAMTGQEILEAIGTFVLHDSHIDDPVRYDSLTFARGSVTIASEWMTPVTTTANYQERLNGHIYTDEVMVYPIEGGEPFEPGRVPGTMIIREDNIYFYLHGLTWPSLQEFVPSSIPDGIQPEPVGPPRPAPAHGDCPQPSTVVGATGSKISYSFSASPHPRGEGNTVLVSVYNDEWYQNGDFWGNRLIGDFYKIPEEEFVVLSLPEAPAPLGQYGEGWTFEPIGYILYYGPLQVTEDTYGTFYWAEDTEFAIMLYGNQLTWDEVQFVPPDEYGVRYVNIHVVYARNAGDGAILADDGLGNVTAYDTAVSPLQSAGVTWLATLPTPEMDCYYFAGWYDEEGVQIWYVWNEDIYEYWYDSDTDESGVNIHPAKIYAGWVEATDPLAAP